MKKILFIILSLLCIPTMAQQYYSFIVQGGYQSFNISKNESSIVKSGFRLGGSMDYLFLVGQTVDFSIQAGLYYSSKGNKLMLKDKGFVEFKDKKAHYLSVPILFNTRFLINDKTNIFVNGGCYGELGLGNERPKRIKNENKPGKPDHSFEIDLERDDHIFQTFDVGLQAGGGIEYNRVMLGLSLQYSTMHLLSLSDHPSIFGIHATIGYRF